MGIMADRVSMGQAFLEVPWVSPLSIIPSKPHTHAFIYNRRCTVAAIDTTVK